MPRVLGYVFNPISVYFCHRADGTLGAILYEVSNTFGERHSYLIPVEEDADGQVRQNCGKALHVSPFIAMDVSYDFRVAPPGERVTIAIAEHDADGAAADRLLRGAAPGRSATRRCCGHSSPTRCSRSRSSAASTGRRCVSGSRAFR